MKIITTFATLVAICLGSSLSAATVNLIRNGDFEAGGTDFTTDFGYSILSGVQTTIVAPHICKAFFNQNTCDRPGDHTTGTGLAQFVNGSTNRTAVFWRQTVDVLAGADYNFSLWGTLWFGGTSVQQLFINGQNVGNISITTARDVWQNYALTWNSGTATSATLELVNFSAEFSGNDFAIDDISFSTDAVPATVPVPATGLMLLTGLGLLLARRRKV